MVRVGWGEAIFSVKTFAAAMLALYIAFSLGLTQPGWAMLTVYVVAQPVAGMVIAKSLFRFAGTVVGAVMALVLVAALASAPVLFLVALALWIGACNVASVLMRDAPGAYAAMLSGYTAAIIGIPSALAPETAFDTASWRCVEITLGILCATVVNRIVFPRTAGQGLARTIDACMNASARWTVDTLRNESDAGGLADLRALIADVVAIENLRVYSRFEAPAARAAAETARHLQGQFLSLVAVLVSIHDRVLLLRTRAPELQPRLERLMDEVADLVEASRSGDPQAGAGATALEAEIRDRLPSFDDMVRDHRTILVRNILLRLVDVLITWRRVVTLRALLAAGRVPDRDEPVPSPARYRDYSLAFVAAATTVAAVLGSAAFWIVTAWPNGSSAVVFAGVIGSIFATLDDPVRAAGNFFRMTVLSAVVAGLYLFWVFPWIEGFPALVAVLAPFFIPVGMLAALPRVGTSVLPLGLNAVALIGFNNVGTSLDFAAYVNSAVGLLAGIGAGVLAFRLLRPLGADWAIRRIRAGALRDLERLARRARPESRARFQSRMLDRINALFGRLDPARPEQREFMRGCFASLRIGLNILALRRSIPDLPPDAARAVERALIVLAGHFRGRSGWRNARATLPELDDAVVVLLASGPGPAAETTLVALVAIGSALYRHAEFFVVERGRIVPEALRPAVPA